MEEIARVNPKFDSQLTKTLFELERIRYSELEASTPPWLFFDLKDIMHFLESVASARIEGNRTTLVSAANDVVHGDKPTTNESLIELRNIRNGIAFIEDQLKDGKTISLSMVREMHKLTVNSLKNDGSKTPGKFRSEDVSISGSDHTPPSHVHVQGLMQDLVDYINEDSGRQYDIIKIAIAHHRFAAIHPFDNGNGRTARLLTYAMLMQANFIDDGIRLLNPSSIFCMDRKEYYRLLNVADRGGVRNLEKWCEYVARGILDEISRVSKLLDKKFTTSEILLPTLKIAYADKKISQNEYDILKIAMEKDVIQAGDVGHLFGTTPSAKVKTSRALASMKEKGLLMSPPKWTNKYVMRFSNNHLLADVLSNMNKNDLLPISEDA